jgi:hypothetical protein
MSLEQKIEDLTAAVLALTTVVRGQVIMGSPMPVAGEPGVNPVPDHIVKAVAEKPKAAKPKAEPKAEEKPAAVDYDAMAKAFKDYIGSQGRDAAVELLATFEAKTLKDVPEAKWPLMMKAIS